MVADESQEIAEASNQSGNGQWSMVNGQRPIRPRYAKRYAKRYGLGSPEAGIDSVISRGRNTPMGKDKCRLLRATEAMLYTLMSKKV